jgi:hypothetical protein
MLSTLFPAECLAVGSECGSEAVSGDEDAMGAHGTGAALTHIEGAVGDLGVSSEESGIADGERCFENGQRCQLRGAFQSFDGQP